MYKTSQNYPKDLEFGHEKSQFCRNKSSPYPLFLGPWAAILAKQLLKRLSGCKVMAISVSSTIANFGGVLHHVQASDCHGTGSNVMSTTNTVIVTQGTCASAMCVAHCMPSKMAVMQNGTCSHFTGKHVQCHSAQHHKQFLVGLQILVRHTGGYLLMTLHVDMNCSARTAKHITAWHDTVDMNSKVCRYVAPQPKGYCLHSQSCCVVL